MLWSKPPAAKTTPRRAVTVISRPSCSTTAPVTLAPSVVNRTNLVSVQTPNAGAQYSGEQSGGQRLTAGGVVAAEQQATDPLAKPLDDERQALAGYPGHQVHPPVVRTRGRHGDRRLHHCGAQSRPVLTEHRRVERFALACPAGGASSRVLRVVIGVVPRPHEPQRRGAPQHLHRLRRDVRGIPWAAVGVRCLPRPNPDRSSPAPWCHPRRSRRGSDSQAATARRRTGPWIRRRTPTSPRSAPSDHALQPPAPRPCPCRSRPPTVHGGVADRQADGDGCPGRAVVMILDSKSQGRGRGGFFPASGTVGSHYRRRGCRTRS